MVACTEKNTPDNGGGEEGGGSETKTDTTITTTDTLRITWSGASAVVKGSHDGVSITSENGYVTVTSTVKDISYLLSGEGQGQLTIYGTNRHQLILNDLTLTCSNGPAINNQCKKSCFVLLEGSNALTDSKTYASSDEDRKAAFFSEGQMIFSGGGSLTINGNYKHALASDDYIQFAQSTGTLTITATVNDGIHANDGIFIDGGTFAITSKDEGIRTDSNTIVINGGTINVISKSEGIESKGTLVINGGFVFSQATDDAINSGGDLTINGGYVCAYSTSNDGIDANGNCYIKGGVIYAIGARSPEVAIDANSEAKKQLYVQGGTIVTIGSLENGASLTQACYQSSSVSSGKWYALYNDGELAFVFKALGSTTPMVGSTSGTPSLHSTVTVRGGTSIFSGNALLEASVSGGSNVTLSNYTGGGGGPGGGGSGGGGGRPW